MAGKDQVKLGKDHRDGGAMERAGMDSEVDGTG